LTGAGKSEDPIQRRGRKSWKVNGGGRSPAKGRREGRKGRVDGSDKAHSSKRSGAGKVGESICVEIRGGLQKKLLLGTKLGERGVANAAKDASRRANKV